jgi:hypothetical protein
MGFFMEHAANRSERYHTIKHKTPWDFGGVFKTTTSTVVTFGRFHMGRKSNYLMERVYANLSKVRPFDRSGVD